MSHSAIEQAYEDDMKAEVRWLNLYVGGKWKRDEPDTPAGRVRMEKWAFTARLEADAETTVEVFRGEAGERIQRPESSEGHPGDPKSVPASALSTCCTPRRYPAPSGVRLRHAWDCTAGLRGQPYAPAPTQPRVSRLGRRLMAESRRTGLDDLLTRGGVLTATDDRCPAHPGESVWDCVTCSDRRKA